jgi:hypothetical protein
VRRLAAIVVAVGAAVGLAGCPKPAARPVLDGSWPAAAPSYRPTVETWTRAADIQDSYQLIARIHATLLSPAWRTAMIERRVRIGKLGDDGRAELEAAQRAADEAAWEVVIVMSTWDRRENDLDRGKKSIWRVVLVDDQDNEIEPIEIVKDKRPAFTVRADYAAYGDFATAYIARFPRDKQLLGDGVKRVRLRLSRVRGGIELTWTAQP